MSKLLSDHRAGTGALLLAAVAAAMALGPSACGGPRETSGPPSSIEAVESPGPGIAGREPVLGAIGRRMNHEDVPGVGVAVVEGGEIAWAGGYGLADRNSGARVTAQTLFQAASMSKPVAALAVLRLVEAGTLSLDEDVNAYLRSWRVPDNEHTGESRVTLRRILSHTAGLTVHGFPGYRRDAPLPTIPQILDGAPPANTGPVRVTAVPGTEHRYSGGGFTIAQLVATEVTGEPFPALVRRLVLEPLGMEHSTFEQPLPPSLRDRAASGHRQDGAPVTGGFHVYPEMAAAGLWTTPSDLARFALGIGRALDVGDRRREPSSADDPGGLVGEILSPETAALMLAPVVPGQGLGVAVQGEDESLRFGHAGSNEGFRGRFVHFPRRGQGAVVMTNSDAGVALAEGILRDVAAAYGWDDPEFRPRVAGDAEVPSAKTPSKPAR